QGGKAQPGGDPVNNPVYRIVHSLLGPAQQHKEQEFQPSSNQADEEEGRIKEAHQIPDVSRSHQALSANTPQSPDSNDQQHPAEENPEHQRPGFRLIPVLSVKIEQPQCTGQN